MTCGVPQCLSAEAHCRGGTQLAQTQLRPALSTILWLAPDVGEVLLTHAGVVVGAGGAGWWARRTGGPEDRAGCC